MRFAPVPSESLRGVDWKSIFNAIPSFATAEAMALAWAPITGTRPAVVNRGEYYELIFDADQEDRAAAWIVMQLNSEPGPVRVNAGGIASKVIARKYWPWILGVAAAGGLIGYMAARK